MQKITFHDAWSDLKRSFQLGNEHYLVLFLGALCFTGVTYLVQAVPNLSFLATILGVLWTAGQVYVVQTLVSGEKPVLAQFFIAFQKQSVLKRLIPKFLLFLIVTAMILPFAAIFIFLQVQALRDGQIPTPAAVAPIIILILSVSFVVSIPLVFFDFVLLLTQHKFIQIVKISFLGFFKNWMVILPFAFLIGPLPTILISLLPGFFEVDAQIAESVSQSITIPLTFISPFFISFNYLLYQRIFKSELPEVQIKDMP